MLYFRSTYISPLYPEPMIVSANDCAQVTVLYFRQQLRTSPVHDTACRPKSLPTILKIIVTRFRLQVVLSSWMQNLNDKRCWKPMPVLKKKFRYSIELFIQNKKNEISSVVSWVYPPFHTSTCNVLEVHIHGAFLRQRYKSTDSKVKSILLNDK